MRDKISLKRSAVLSFHELDDVADIVAMDVEMSLRSRIRQRAGGVRLEVGKVPALKEIAKPRDPWVLLESPKCGDSELTKVRQLDEFAGRILFLIGRDFESRLSGPNRTFTLFEPEKGKRPTVALPVAALPERLGLNVGTT